VLREVPLDSLVHEIAKAGTELERDDGGRLFRAFGHVLVRRDVFALPRPDGFASAPRLPDNVSDKTRGVATVEHLGWLDLAKTVALGEDEDVPSSVELRWRPGDVQAASSLL
jgi:hypothetical protein